MRYVIWSTKHGGAFWRDGGHGYVDNPDIAGQFTEDEAHQICDPSKECTYYHIADGFVQGKRRHYLEKKRGSIRSCLETMTPKQVLEVMVELVQERVDLYVKGGI